MAALAALALLSLTPVIEVRRMNRSRRGRKGFDQSVKTATGQESMADVRPGETRGSCANGRHMRKEVITLNPDEQVGTEDTHFICSRHVLIFSRSTFAGSPDSTAVHVGRFTQFHSPRASRADL